MHQIAIDSIARALTISLGVPVRPTLLEPPSVSDTARDMLRDRNQTFGWLEFGGQEYFCAIFDGLSDELLIAGPLDRSAASYRGETLTDEQLRERISEAVKAAAHGLRLALEDPQLRLEVSRQMELLSNAIVAVSGELDLDIVLRRIVDLARNFSTARYAALGIPGPSGLLMTFITAGLTPDEEARIGDLPQGYGILGWLLKQSHPIRIANLGSHPMSGGFPPNHPKMENFLGVPIIARGGKVVGSLYLTEKRFADEFTVEDELIVDLLARHAAVAIENAQLYQSVQSHEKRLASMVDQLPEAVVLIESDPARISIMNQHARALLDLHDPLPITIEHIRDRYQFQDEADQPIDINKIAPLRSLELGEVVIREHLTIQNANGTRRSLLVNSAPLDPERPEQSAISVFQDISEIRDSDRLKDDFLSLVSHELRTPLTTIHGGSQILLSMMGKLDEETIKELLTDIHQESARLSSLIQNIVQLTHIRAGRVALDLEPMLLRGVVNRSVERLRGQASDWEFRIDVEPGMIVLADEERVDEMLTNVLQNAIKYAPDSKLIEVRGRAGDGCVELSVRDHGPGIPAHELATAFERFERGSQASSRTPGMGLGLYIVKLLVESQGGNVRLELPADGGTEIVMTLPIAQAGE